MTRLPSSGPVALAAGLGAVAGVLVGVLVGRALFEPGAAAPGSGGEDRLSTALAELRGAEERLAGVLTGLENSLRSLPRSTASTDARESVGEPVSSPSLAELARGLDALRETFARESDATRELLRASPVFESESLVELRERRADTDWSALGRLEQQWRADGAAASRSQLFQTARDLLRTYGPPDAIYRPKRGGLQLVYRDHREGEPGPAWYFWLQDGFVVEFFVEDEER